MVTTISRSLVQLDFDQYECDFRNNYASKEPRIQFSIHPCSTLIEIWNFILGDNYRPIHLRTMQTAIVGASVELNPPSYLTNKEARRCTILGLISRVDVDLEAKECIVDEIILQTDEVVQSMNGFGRGDGDKFYWYVSVKLSVLQQNELYDEDIDNHDEITRLFDDDHDDNRIVEGMSSSSPNVVMIPATKKAIERLETVKNIDIETDFNTCTICLDDIIKEGTEVSRLNCTHVFHGDCIRLWLQRSHYCPLCRFELPT